MDIPEVTRKLLAAKKRKGLSFADLEKTVGRDEVWIAALFYRQAMASPEEAKELADQYFLETLIRLHRAGEGAPYTGIKDEPVAPIVALADKSLDIVGIYTPHHLHASLAIAAALKGYALKDGRHFRWSLCWSYN